MVQIRIYTMTNQVLRRNISFVIAFIMANGLTVFLFEMIYGWVMAQRDHVAYSLRI